MPLAEERLQEKVPFDVYAVMLLVTALITIGGILMLNADLRENWGGAEVPGTVKHAENVTKINGQTDEEKTTSGVSPWIQVTEADKADYQAITGQELKTPEYPAWMAVNAAGVNFINEIKEINAFDLNKVPAEEREAMKNSYTETVDPTTGVLEQKPQE